MEKDISPFVFNSIKETLNRFSHIDCTEKVNSHEELIKIFRSIFGDKYEKNPSCDVVLDDPCMRLKTLKQLFESLDCFWLDLIGCDNFSLLSKQLFYTTISASEAISNSRMPIVKTYNELCEKNIPIDIFLQLFYNKRSNNILLDIQDNGLVVEYGTDKYLNSNGFNSLYLSHETISLFSHDTDRCFLPTYESLNAEIDKLVAIINKENIHLEKKSLLYETCRLNKCLYDKLNFLYFIPIPSPKSMGYIGHFCCGTGRRLTVEEIENMSILSFTLLYPFVSSSKSLYDQTVINKEAIKSAISAIMARNMSHNLGSHFISNTKHYFSNLAENEEDEQRQKDCRGIRHTLQYIQERMDFIATIVSTDRFPYGPVNVKSQIFDELTPDEFGGRHEKATTNFLLDYIVFSEDISKQSNLSKSSIKLSLKLVSDYGKEFGGQGHENQEAKEEFAKLNLAVPGGLLGRHAIFTIIENVIRNSAKHDKENIPKEGLNVSIKIGKNYIIIFDNKKNAKKNISGTILIDELQKRYTEIKILSDGTIDKSNKGLKEILISALWLNNYSLADWFGDYENTSIKDKIKKLSEVLKIVTVEDNGNITDNGENLGYYITLDKYEEVYHIEDNIVNMGDKIYYSSISGIKADIIAANRDYEVLIDENIHQNGDSDVDSNSVLRLSDLYPRFYENKAGGELPQVEDMMKTIMIRNTGIQLEELNGMDIHIEPKNSALPSNTVNHCIWHTTSEANGIRKNDILFKNHLSVLKTEEIDRVLAAYGDAAYIDSISGGDFTGTITQPFFLQNEFNRLKVLESALTEFVIIDERVFKNYGHGFKPLDGDVKLESNKSILEAEKIFNEVEDLLCLEKSVDDITDSIYNRYDIVLNVSLLNGDNKEQIREDIDKKIAKQKNKAATEAEKTENNSDNISALHKMIEKRKLHIYDIDKNGNILNLKGKSIANVIKFNDMDKLCSPTFLSIHLSIIEKITKENGVPASQVMANLKKLFGNTKFVTIHSGRGNLSAELEKELKDYAFLSLSAIQAAMDDSKYFLSQLLYNNCYIGKGRLNHK